MKFKLKKDNFNGYYDCGIGNPFDTKEIINFCIENQKLFGEEVRQQDGHCWMCDDDEGLDIYYFFYFDTDSRMELFKNSITGAEEILNDEFNDIESISFGYCKACKKWVVTH